MPFFLKRGDRWYTDDGCQIALAVRIGTERSSNCTQIGRTFLYQKCDKRPGVIVSKDAIPIIPLPLCQQSVQIRRNRAAAQAVESSARSSAIETGEIFRDSFIDPPFWLSMIPSVMPRAGKEIASGEVVPELVRDCFIGGVDTFGSIAEIGIEYTTILDIHPIDIRAESDKCQHILTEHAPVGEEFDRQHFRRIVGHRIGQAGQFKKCIAQVFQACCDGFQIRGR
jgi:hypothetical protein